jgi:hypothetical protein
VLCWSSRSVRFLYTHATSLISWFVGEHRQNLSEEAEFPALIIICIQANLEARGGEFEFLNSWIWPRKKGGWLTKHMLNQLKTKKLRKWCGQSAGNKPTGNQTVLKAKLFILSIALRTAGTKAYVWLNFFEAPTVSRSSRWMWTNTFRKTVKNHWGPNDGIATLSSGWAQFTCGLKENFAGKQCFHP